MTLAFLINWTYMYCLKSDYLNVIIHVLGIEYEGRQQVKVNIEAKNEY